MFGAASIPIIFYIAQAMTVGGGAGGNGHAVVMRVNQVGVGVDIKQ